MPSPKDKEKLIEVVEYWNKEDKVYEFMLATEFDKKQAGLPYEVMMKDTVAPFVIVKDRKDIKWVAQKRWIDKTN